MDLAGEGGGNIGVQPDQRLLIEAGRQYHLSIFLPVSSILGPPLKFLGVICHSTLSLLQGYQPQLKVRTGALEELTKVLHHSLPVRRRTIAYPVT